ncbi:MAG: hypothetical protein ACRDLN_13745 [Solirubrobacteraceae bacterium]
MTALSAAPRFALAVLSAGVVASCAPAANAADPLRYKAYYDIFNRGNALIPGHDTRWVPQGLTYWPDRDALIISYYDASKKLDSRLAVIDRASGRKQSIFELPEKGHVGGLAMSDGNLWVASSGTVSRISKPNLARAADGDRLPVDSEHKLAATSFATFDGANLWVGKYETDARKSRYAYRYPLGADELPAKTYDRRVAIPTSVQGMAIRGGRVLLSRSGGHGIDADSSLEVRSLGNLNGRPGRVITAPNMSEGVVFGNGKVHVLYESGAKKYAGADYRVKTVHHGRISDLL